MSANIKQRIFRSAHKKLLPQFHIAEQEKTGKRRLARGLLPLYTSTRKRLRVPQKRFPKSDPSAKSPKPDISSNLATLEMR
jgi:hypothetical protein